MLRQFNWKIETAYDIYEVQPQAAFVETMTMVV